MVWLVGWPSVFIMLAVEETSIDQYQYWWLILIMGLYGVVLQVIITPFISYLALASPQEEVLPDYGEMYDSTSESNSHYKYREWHPAPAGLSERLIDDQP